MHRLIVPNLSAATVLALLPLIAKPASAECQFPQTSANKTLSSGATDTKSYFTLTQGTATIEVDLRSIADSCSGDGITFKVVSRQTGKTVNCSGNTSEQGPAEYLRCNVNVGGGEYSVRVKNPTDCKATYRTICVGNTNGEDGD